MACATVTGIGTYAFIKWVVAPNLLPVCNYDTSNWSGSFFGDGHYFYARVYSTCRLAHVVTYTVIIPDLQSFCSTNWQHDSLWNSRIYP